MTRVLPSGTSGLLLELEDLDAVMGLYGALDVARPAGVVDVIPAARTLLVVVDPQAAPLAEVERAVRQLRPRERERATTDVVELPVIYDGEDLAEVARLLDCDTQEVVRRHSGTEWTVAFCGFSPGFGYMTASTGTWDVPRRSTPRTKVPAGSVGLAGEFSGVYPRESPGGWQLIGRTDVAVFDLRRHPPALLRPDTRVRFVPVEPP